MGSVFFAKLAKRREALQIPAALVVAWRRGYDALARSSSSCAGLKDKKSGLEALALQQSIVESGTMVRWSHSAAQLGDVVTKDSYVARAPWELFVRRGFRWKLIDDPKVRILTKPCKTWT